MFLQTKMITVIGLNPEAFIPSSDVSQFSCLKMTSAQVVETSVNVTSNSPSKEYTHPDDHNLRTYKMITLKRINELPV